MRNPFARNRSRTSRRRPSSARSSLLLFWAFVVLFPIYWLFVTSFKTPYDVDKGPFYIPFVDFAPTLDAWRYILVELGNDTLRPYTNTVIVGLSSSIIALVLGSFTAYALVRFTYRPRSGSSVSASGSGASRSSPPCGRRRLLAGRGVAIFAILAQTIGRRFTRRSATATSRSG
jgi:multiple sugar transport system permease protein